MILQPKQLFAFSGSNGEKLVVMKCLQHGSHVCVGFGTSEFISCLHMHVDEALNFADVLRAGSSWAGLQLQPPVLGDEGPTHQGGVTVRDGLYCITLSRDMYIVSLAPKALPAVIANMGPDSREKVAAAIGEVVHGKAVAA